MSLSTVILVFSFMNNQGDIASNQYILQNSVKECIEANNFRSALYMKHYTQGAYVGQCIENGHLVHVNQNFAGRMLTQPTVK